MFFSAGDGSGEKIFSGDKTFLHFYHGDHQLLAASLGQGLTRLHPIILEYKRFQVFFVIYYYEREQSNKLMTSDQGLIGH